MKTKEKVRLSYNLRRHRAIAGWNQKQMADLIGCRVEMISRWERCKNWPSKKYRDILEKWGIL